MICQMSQTVCIIRAGGFTADFVLLFISYKFVKGFLEMTF